MAIRRSPKGQDPSDFQDAEGGSSLRPAGPGAGSPTPVGPGQGLGYVSPEGPYPDAGGSATYGRGASGPRENQDQSLQGGNATLRRPMSPTPMAGSAFQGGDGSPRAHAGPVGMQPFTPMGGGPNPGQMAGIGGLFGSAGGLKGGGLGVPLNPMGDAPNEGIEGLLQLLMQMKGGG